MDVKDAVKRAKAYVADLFAEEGVFDLGLEEVEHQNGDVWSVTIGFNRQPALASTSDVATGGALARLLTRSNAGRIYRVVRVRESDGEILSVKRTDSTEDAA